jgi:hypothetical protein
MGLIELQVQSNAPVHVVYELAHSATDFVDVMPNIKEIRKLSQNEDHSYSKTQWVLDFPLPALFGELSWVKDTFWNDDGRMCDIRLNPDCRSIVKRIDGKWTFRPLPLGCEMSMNMYVKVSHPLVGRKTKATIDALMATNIENLMKAISRKAELSTQYTSI